MNLLRQKDIGFIFCQTCVLILALLPVSRSLDNSIYDLTVGTTVYKSDPGISLISIDAKSLEALGRWPWPRYLHAEMIDLLTKADTKTIGYNIAFIEPDYSENSSDDLLRQHVADHGNLVFPVFAERGITLLPFREGQAISGSSLGHVDIEVDPDGYVRRFYLKAGIDTPRWPAFGLTLLQRIENHTGFLPGTRSPSSRVGTHNKWQRDLEVLVPFSASAAPFPSYSFIDILEGNVSLELLKDRTVLVGIEATGIEPKFLVPGANHREMLSGTWLQASLFYALKESTLLTPILSIWGLSYAILLTALLYSLIFFLKRLPILRTLVAVIAIGLLTLPILAIRFGYWLPLSPAVTGIASISLLYALTRLLSFDSERRNDNITDLANHRMLLETLRIEWEQSQRKHTPLSILMVEIDFFSRFTDTFGPERGDWVLARISPLLQQHKRKNRDLVARFNKDTFAILLPLTPFNIAQSLAEKIRRDIEELQIEHSGSNCSNVITASVGFATRCDSSDSTCANLPFHQLIDEALVALKQAKQKNGNCVYPND